MTCTRGFYANLAYLLCMSGCCHAALACRQSCSAAHGSWLAQHAVPCPAPIPAEEMCIQPVCSICGWMLGMEMLAVTLKPSTWHKMLPFPAYRNVSAHCSRCNNSCKQLSTHARCAGLDAGHVPAFPAPPAPTARKTAVPDWVRQELLKRRVQSDRAAAGEPPVHVSSPALGSFMPCGWPFRRSSCAQWL